MLLLDLDCLDGLVLVDARYLVEVHFFVVTLFLGHLPPCRVLRRNIDLFLMNFYPLSRLDIHIMHLGYRLYFCAYLLVFARDNGVTEIYVRAILVPPLTIDRKFFFLDLYPPYFFLISDNIFHYASLGILFSDGSMFVGNGDLFLKAVFFVL